MPKKFKKELQNQSKKQKVASSSLISKNLINRSIPQIMSISVQQKIANLEKCLIKIKSPEKDAIKNGKSNDKTEISTKPEQSTVKRRPGRPKLKKPES